MKQNAYAKLNLALAITGRRSDGYHTLDMIMQQIDLHDVVEMERAEGLHVFCGDVCDMRQNTAYRAARLFFERTGIPPGVSIQIEKHIPPQAGLGGGSSDAATVLLMLNKLFHAGLSAEELAGIAVRVGADVPFFLVGGCARAQGVGEALFPLQNNCKFSYVLVKPECGVDTAAAYAAYHTLPTEPVDVQGAAHALFAGDAQAYFASAGNALFSAGRALCPEVGRAVSDCRAQGARFAMMTGSGSCVFAVFDDPAPAAAALREKYPFVAVAHDLR
ncbi:MAG TPA: 4-(cytidine 5'-diphospho)-2-C-methyl-D-erythritol kinase [Clostridiales bacterium]|nr:4-(cytidine 5'-diphospho)-2-C-methyl-D-erythritol kinase [Clostridiales bacterium]